MRKRRLLAYALSLIYFILLDIVVKPSVNSYNVRGVDVARYQGTIDWELLSEQGINFAFIKATEGSGHVDIRFAENWEAISQTEILAAPYHFFSFDSSGITQAENFIETVGKRRGMLPPAVDVEFYGDYVKKPKASDEVRQILKDMLGALERFYGVKPIIYATRSAYELYIEDHFNEYPLWIRNVYYLPFWDGIYGWSFWQYSDRGHLQGHEGDHIDLNVYKGTLNELESLTIT